MNKKILLLALAFMMVFTACTDETKQENLTTESQSELKQSPLDELKQVDELLAELSEKQILTTTSIEKTRVIGIKGTIIYVDPSRLETLDGTPLGDKIDIELIEMTDNQSLIYNNAHTVSNSKMLVTGGAYYINMTTNGKQLRMKKGESFAVEFPKLTNEEMDLFLGERDETGQINWIKTEEKFQAKKIPNVIKPVEPTIYVIEREVISDSSDMVAPKEINRNEVSKEEYEKYLGELRIYEERKKEIAYQRKTYQAVELLNFGWINCDIFYEDQNALTNIEFFIENDSISAARIFILFKDIESLMAVFYSKKQKGGTVLENIPEGRNIHIVALAVENEESYFFEKSMVTQPQNVVEVKLKKTSQEDIAKMINRIDSMN